MKSLFPLNTSEWTSHAHNQFSITRTNFSAEYNSLYPIHEEASFNTQEASWSGNQKKKKKSSQIGNIHNQA